MKKFFIGFGIAVAMFVCMSFTKYFPTTHTDIRVETITVDGSKYIVVGNEYGLAICPATK